MKCGSCTLCCELLELHTIPSEIEKYCQHCDPAEGCTIYLKRPEECCIYKCMWLQMDNAGIELRPDKSHIIFDKISDKVICARQDSNYVLGKLVLNQIARFNEDDFSVVIRYKNEKRVYLAKGHMMEDVKGVINDRSKLY